MLHVPHVCTRSYNYITLQWRHNGCDGVSNHQPQHCFSNVYKDADQIKHQSAASLAFVRGIHRWPVNFPHKWPVTRKMFPFDDVIKHVVHSSRLAETYFAITNCDSPTAVKHIGWSAVVSLECLLSGLSCLIASLWRVVCCLPAFAIISYILQWIWEPYMVNRMARQWAETLVEIRGTLADIRGTTKLGCRGNFPKHEFNRPVCLEAHHYLLAHLSQ